MASQIKRERVLGNFKPSAGQKLKAKSAKPSAAERRDGMSKEHLACIRKCWCVACLPAIRIAGEAHHLKQGTGERGMGLRSTDKHSVPLCRQHHEEVERIGAKNEAALFRSWGISDHLQLSLDLHRNSGDVKAMNKIVLAHKGVTHAKRP